MCHRKCSQCLESSLKGVETIMRRDTVQSEDVENGKLHEVEKQALKSTRLNCSWSTPEADSKCKVKPSRLPQRKLRTGERQSPILKVPGEARLQAAELPAAAEGRRAWGALSHLQTRVPATQELLLRRGARGSCGRGTPSPPLNRAPRAS